MLKNMQEKIGYLRETQLGSFIPVLLALIAIWVYFGIVEPVFLSPRNFYFLFMQSAVVGTLAVGVTLVLLMGDIDLSIATVAGVCAAIVAVLSTKMGVSAPIACLAGLGAGALLGGIMGTIIAYFRVPSFVVTLAGLLGFQGLMMKILGIHGAINVRDPFIRGLTTTTLPDSIGLILAAIGIIIFGLAIWNNRRARNAKNLDNDLLYVSIIKFIFFSTLVLTATLILNAYRGVPLTIIILLSITGFLGWLTTSTSYGRAMFAVGGNLESARRVGISIEYMRISAFALVGFMAAVGGIIGASRYASVSFNAFAGGPLLLEAIGAAVIGGTSLFGGRGSVWNAILGALVIGSLGNGLDLAGARAADKLMFSGAILLIAVTLDAVTRGATSRK